MVLENIIVFINTNIKTT